MVSLNRLANGLCAFALMVAFGMATVTPAQAVTDLERYDAMNLAPMPDELADGLRGEAGEGSLIYNLAMTGACLKLPGYSSLICGVGAIFGEYAYNNRRSILYMLAKQGGSLAKVTTPCMIANGVKYYCL